MYPVDSIKYLRTIAQVSFLTCLQNTTVDDVDDVHGMYPSSMVGKAPRHWCKPILYQAGQQ